MIQKIILSVFASILLLAFVSASVTIDNVNLGNVVPGSVNSFSFTVQNTENSNVSVTLESTSGVSFTTSNVAVNASSNRTIPSNTFTVASNATSGSKSVTVKYVKNISGVLSDSSFNINMVVTPVSSQSFCSAGQAGSNLSIKNVDISSSGDDDNEWKFLDVITVEVEVENTNDDEDIEDVIVELGLFDSDGSDFTDELEFINDDEEEIELGDIGDGDEETVTFEFTVPADFDAGSYRLMVKAFSDDLGEQNECDATANDLSDGSNTYESVSVEEEDDEGKFIGFDSVELSSEELTCGDTGLLSLTAYNIGDDDQDRVRITLSNSVLRIEEVYEIRNDFDQGDDEDISFDFAIPANARDGNYVLNVNAEYDYKNGAYREELEDLFEAATIKVIGCESTVPQAERIANIIANYDSAKAGEEFVVEATVRNLLTEEATFLIDVDDYSSWAELVDVSDRTLTLAAGESGVVEVTLKANSDSQAEESFTITALSDGESETETVAVDVDSGSSISLGSGSLPWIIGAINLILIILIIVIAVKLSRR